MKVTSIRNESFQKRSTPQGRNFCRRGGGGGEKNLFPIIVNVLGHPKGVGVLTSNFLRGGGMDAFWNDPREFQYLDSNLAFIS